MTSSGSPVDEATGMDLDGDANDRVHHHARLDDEGAIGGGEFTTLCGLRITARPDAATLPCCPMCALVMGRACN